MPLRLYWTDAAPDVSPGFKGPNWDKTTGAVQRKLGAKAGANANTGSITKGNASTTWDVAHGAFVSDPILRDASVPATETLAVTMGRNASTASAIRSVIYAYFLTPAGAVRSVLWDRVGTSNWGTTAANGGWNAAAVTAAAAVAGDRLVVEVGYRGITASSAPGATMWYGGTGTDFSITAGDTAVTTKVGWIELDGANLESLWTPLAPTVDAGADASITAGDTFARTATEGGGTPDTRAWTIVSGPTGSGTTIGTAAALSWPSPAVGVYVLRYTATNTGGSDTDDVTVTVNPEPGRRLLLAT